MVGRGDYRDGASRIAVSCDYSYQRYFVQMDEDTRHHIIFRILSAAFPNEVASHSERAEGVEFFPILADGVVPTPQRKSAEALRDELTALDDQTLVSKLEDVIEAQHFLNQSRFFATSADYEYWVKLATWEIYQATALLLGRRPDDIDITCLLYTSPSPRDQRGSRMPSSA